MKYLYLTLLLVIGGCSIILPKPHDAIMFDQIVSIDISVNKLSCSNKEWGDLLQKTEHLKLYTELRGDPQAPAIAQLHEALQKANVSQNETFCNSVININKVRIQTIEKAWKGR
jgi:hypothetical protein